MNYRNIDTESMTMPPDEIWTWNRNKEAGSEICQSRVDISRSCFIYTVDVMRREVRSDEK